MGCRRAFHRHPGRATPSQTRLRLLRLRCSSCHHRGGKEAFCFPEHPNGPREPEAHGRSPKTREGGRRSRQTGGPQKEVDFQATLTLSVSCILLRRRPPKPPNRRPPERSRFSGYPHFKRFLHPSAKEAAEAAKQAAPRKK